MLRIAEQWHGSDLGRRRQGNEDNYFVRAPLFAVADGMGGAQAGEVASQMAVEALGPGLPDSASPAEALVRVIEEANRRIHESSRVDERRAGMGTTLTAAYVAEDAVTIAHVGDSRGYLLRDGDLVRLTRDHSLVGELVARGKLTEEQAEVHPQRSVVTRVLGPEPTVQVDVETFPGRPGDVFLLCSDGLTSMVPESALKPMLTAGASLERIGRSLIAAANDAGGRDNITAILFRLEDARATAPAAGDEEETSEHDLLARGADEGATRVREEDALRPGEARAAVGDATEAEYRRSGTVALSPVRPRAEPVERPRASPSRAAAPPRRRRRRISAGWVLLACTVAALLIALWTATRQVYFVGTDPARADAVTIYRGLPYDGPLGIRLYSPVLSSGMTLAQVPAARRRSFTGHKLRSRDDAQSLVRSLERGQLQ